MAVPTKLAQSGRSYKGAKRGAKATEAERETVYGHMSTDSAVWEFIDACEQWKKDNSRTFVPQSAIFQIILKLGYRKLGNVYKVCDSCGSFFTPREGETPGGWKRRKYCNPDCAKSASFDLNHLTELNIAFKQCESCGAIFTRGRESDSDWKRRKYCSKGCMGAAAAHIPEEKRSKVCKGCNCTFSPEFMETPQSWYRREFCTPECQKIHKGGHVIPDGMRFKTCPACEAIFTPRANETQGQWARRTYCSRACTQSHRKSDRIKKCVQCNCEFYPKQDESDLSWARRKYCSKKCRGLAKVPDNRRQKICVNCNETFYFEGNVSPAQWAERRFCSKSCRSAYIHRKYEWTDEDKQLIIDEYPIKGSSIPGLIDKGYPRSIIKATARRMGVKYIPGQSHVEWKDTESKICEGCGVKVYPGEKESRKVWNARRYCTHRCACEHNKKINFTDEELSILRRDYATKGTKTEIPGKTPRQVQRQANKMGLAFDRSSVSPSSRIFAVKSRKGRPLNLRIPQVLPIKLKDLPAPKNKKKEPKWWESASKVCPVCGKKFGPTVSMRKDRRKWEQKNTCSRSCTWRICKDGDIWTQEEIDTVATHYPLIGSKVLSMINKDQAKLTLWVNTHKIRMRQHKGGKKNIFSPYEEILIRWYYPIIGKKVVQYLKGKTDRQAYSWATRNGIRADSTALEPCDSIAISLFRLTQSENCGRLLVDSC